MRVIADPLGADRGGKKKRFSAGGFERGRGGGGKKNATARKQKRKKKRKIFFSIGKGKKRRWSTQVMEKGGREAVLTSHTRKKRKKTRDNFLSKKLCSIRGGWGREIGRRYWWIGGGFLWREGGDKTTGGMAARESREAPEDVGKEKKIRKKKRGKPGKDDPV